MGAGGYLDLVGGDELVHARDTQPVEHVGRELVEAHLRAGAEGEVRLRLKRGLRVALRLRPSARSGQRVSERRRLRLRGARTSSAPETRFCCVKKLSIESPPGACSRALCTRNLATWRGARVGRAQGWGWGSS